MFSYTANLKYDFIQNSQKSHIQVILLIPNKQILKSSSVKTIQYIWYNRLINHNKLKSFEKKFAKSQKYIGYVLKWISVWTGVTGFVSGYRNMIWLLKKWGDPNLLSLLVLRQQVMFYFQGHIWISKRKRPRVQVTVTMAAPALRLAI